MLGNGERGVGGRHWREKDPSLKDMGNQLKQPAGGGGKWPCQTRSLEKLLWLLSTVWRVDYYSY